jgi:hypothetical protein
MRELGDFGGIPSSHLLGRVSLVGSSLTRRLQRSDRRNPYILYSVVVKAQFQVLNYLDFADCQSSRGVRAIDGQVLTAEW